MSFSFDFIEGSMSIRKVGGQTRVTTVYGVSISWNNVYNVEVKVLGRHLNNLVGLCGTFNNDRSDDLLTSGNITTTNVNVFGNSWKTHPSCEDEHDSPHPCVTNPDRAATVFQNCSALYHSPFSACTGTVDPAVEHYISDCEYDLCDCDSNPTTCLCQVFDAYASACSAKGIHIDWMDDFQQCRKIRFLFFYLFISRRHERIHN